MTFEERIARFNETDQELYSGDIQNKDALPWLLDHAPQLECPDETINEIFAFRAWVFRKHIRSTPEGQVITEFLPEVPWAGKYNTICCAAGFHIREGRWFYGTEDIFKSYIRFWLNHPEHSHTYTAWLPHAALEWCRVTGEFDFGVSLLDRFVQDYLRWERDWLHPCGLFFSRDGEDGMELSISGSGLRPTRNSAMAASAEAITEFAHLAGESDIEAQFREKAETLKTAMELLWDKDFYRVIPEPYVSLADAGTFDFSAVDDAHYVREELGYVPWAFGITPPGRSAAFLQLLSEEGFRAPYGIATAERRHPRFLYESSHECLWNGYVWPFATTQTLQAAANLLHTEEQEHFTKEDYYTLLLQYAQSQHLGDIPWIDENLHPFTGAWQAREILQYRGWKKESGGCERGKDYNHSMFCDLVLTGLLGIDPVSDTLTLHPLIPESWTWFRAANIPFRGAAYSINYEKSTGLTIIKNEGASLATAK